MNGRNKIGFFECVILLVFFLNFEATYAQVPSFNKWDPAKGDIEYLEKEKLENSKLLDSMYNTTPVFFYDQIFTERTIPDIKKLESIDLAGEDLSNMDLSNINLSNKDLSYARIINSDLSGANLENSNLEGAILEGSIFDNTNLKKANLKNVIATNIIAKDSDFSEAKLTDSYWAYAKFNQCNLKETQIINSNFNGAQFKSLVFDKTQSGFNSFWGTFFDTVIFKESNFQKELFLATLFKSCVFDHTTIENSRFKEIIIQSNLALKLYLENNQYLSVEAENGFGKEGWIDEFRKLATGFTTFNGLEVKYTPSTHIEFNDDPFLQGILKAYRDEYILNYAKSVQYWQTINDINSLLNYTKAISESLRRSRDVNITTFYWDANGKLSVSNMSPSQIFRNGINDRIKEMRQSSNPEVNEQRIDKLYREILPERPASDNEQQGDLENIDGDSKWLGLDLASCLAYHCSLRLFDARIFENPEPLTSVFGVDTFIEASELVVRNQNEIINANIKRNLGLKISGGFRPQGSVSANINHAIGAIDFSLNQSSLISDSEKKRLISKELSEELGSSHLVILEEFFWVEKGKTVHYASKEILNNSKLKFNLDNLPDSPPLNPVFSNETPNNPNATIAQINTYYINGRFIRTEWGKPEATAQHIHVQLKNPMINLPKWHRDILNRSWKLYLKQNNISEKTNKEILEFFPLKTSNFDNSSDAFDQLQRIQTEYEVTKNDSLKLLRYKIINQNEDREIAIKLNEELDINKYNLQLKKINEDALKKEIGEFIKVGEDYLFPFQKILIRKVGNKRYKVKLSIYLNNNQEKRHNSYVGSILNNRIRNRLELTSFLENKGFTLKLSFLSYDWYTLNLGDYYIDLKDYKTRNIVDIEIGRNN